MGNNGSGKRMGGVAFRGGGSLKQHGFAAIGGNPHGGNGGAAFGERTRFVQHHRVHLPRRLHGRRVFKPHALAHRRAHARHNRRRGGKTQCARTGNHQHGNRVYQSPRRTARDAPRCEKGNGGNSQHHGHEHGGSAVGQACNRRFAALRFRQSRHHVAQQRIRTQFVGTIIHAA